MIAFRAFIIGVACLLLLSRLKIGGIAEYSVDGFLAKLKIGVFQIRLYPRKKGKKQKEKKKEQKKEIERSAAQAQEQEPVSQKHESANVMQTAEHSNNKGEKGKKKGGKISEVKRYLPLIGEAAGELRHKIVIDSLELRLTAAAQDAMSAAMTFGYSNMVLGMILPILEQNFTVKSKNIYTDIDFSAQAPTIYLNAEVTLRLGQLVSFALRYFIRFLRIYRKGSDSK